MSNYTFHRQRSFYHGFLSLWRYWAISVLFMTIPSIVSPFIAAKWLPIIGLVLAGVLIFLDRTNRLTQSPVCFRLPFIVGLSLGITAVIMTIALTINPDMAGSPHPGINTPNPLLNILIKSPVNIVLAAYYLLRGEKSYYCRACKMRNTNIVDRGVLGNIFSKEAYFQIKLFLVISIINGLVTWGYYHFMYISININASDTFFMTFFPVSMFGMSAIYVASRYYTMWNYYRGQRNLWQHVESTATTLRYIVINDEKILLAAPSEINPDKEFITSDSFKIDTPAVIAIPYRETINQHEAIEQFKNRFEIDDAHIRYLFDSRDFCPYNNIGHFAAFVTGPEDKGTLEGDWFTVREVFQMSQSQMLNSEFVNELKRVYTIAITSKTYDTAGRRLYSIKHYKPTFRLADLRTININFNDNNWLAVAVTNEDKRFYHLRKAWKKIVKGIGK